MFLWYDISSIVLAFIIGSKGPESVCRKGAELGELTDFFIKSKDWIEVWYYLIL